MDAADWIEVLWEILPLPEPPSRTSPNTIAVEDSATCRAVMDVLSRYVREHAAAEDKDSLAVRLASAEPTTELVTLMNRVDVHLVDGRSEMALRELRSATGADWQSLYMIVERWRTLSARDKHHALHLIELRRILESHRVN